jgi:hypothetical protein
MGRVRLDEEKLEALRSWGDRLREAGGEESAAVGRAILMLVEEIDRLHIELWHARIRPIDETSEATDVPVEVGEEPVTSSLRERLRGLLRSDPVDEPEEQSAPAPEADSTAAAQAWIAALRREE